MEQDAMLAPPAREGRPQWVSCAGFVGQCMGAMHRGNAWGQCMGAMHTGLAHARATARAAGRHTRPAPRRAGRYPNCRQRLSRPQNFPGSSQSSSPSAPPCVPAQYLPPHLPPSPFPPPPPFDPLDPGGPPPPPQDRGPHLVPLDCLQGVVPVAADALVNRKQEQVQPIAAQLGGRGFVS
jgi:hypothetical protein